jgi:hypothetical protein
MYANNHTSLNSGFPAVSFYDFFIRNWYKSLSLKYLEEDFFIFLYFRWYFLKKIMSYFVNISNIYKMVVIF